MDSAKRLEKIFSQMERIEEKLARLHKQLDLFKQESPTDTVPSKNLQENISRFEQRLAVFRQSVLYGYGKPLPAPIVRRKFPNHPEILE